MSVRANFLKIDRFDTDDAGVMHVEAIARCPGVLTYKNMDGSVRRELVSPDFLRGFDSDGMPLAGKLGMIPVTNEHPQHLIRKDDAFKRKVAVGQVSDTVHVYNDGRIKVAFEVSDPGTQDDIRSGRKDGVSLGYETDLVFTPGEWNGQRYDAAQRSPFEADHLAVCAYPRAKQARIVRFDADDFAYQVDSEPGDTIKMAQLRLDSGDTFDVPDTVLTAFTNLRADNVAKDRELVSVRADMSKKEQFLENMKGKAESDEEEMKEKDDAIQEAIAQMDALDAEISKLKAVKFDSAAVEAEVASRFDASLDAIDLMVPGFRKHIEEKGFKLDASMRADEIRLAIAKATLPNENFDGASPDEIKGMLRMASRLRGDAAAPTPAVNNDSVAKLQSVISQAIASNGGSARGDSGMSARQKRMDADYARSRQPLTAAK